MYSPQDRVYTTPEVNVSSAYQTLQRLRLESILRRAGFFSFFKPFHWQQEATAPTVQLPRITKTVEPFGASEKKFVKEQPNTTTQTHDIKSNRPTLPSIKPKSHQTKGRHAQCTRQERVKESESYLAGAAKVAYAKSAFRYMQEIYAPFYPQKPVQLPSIQKDVLDQKLTRTKKKNTQGSCLMCEEIKREAKAASTGAWRQSKEDLNKKKRHRKKEQQFREWNESKENFYGKPLDFDMNDAQLFQSQEKFHNINTRLRSDRGYLTYIDLGTDTFHRLSDSLPKAEKKTTVKKRKKLKPLKGEKKMNSNF